MKIMPHSCNQPGFSQKRFVLFICSTCCSFLGYKLTIKHSHFLSELDIPEDSLELGLVDESVEVPVDVAEGSAE